MSDYIRSDIYCDLIIPKTIEFEIIKETDNVLAFYHTKPHWPVHIVVVPKQHIASLLELTDEHNKLARELLSMVQEMASKSQGDNGPGSN